MRIQKILETKFGNPLDGAAEAKAFEVKYLKVWECQKEFPNLPFKRMYVNELIIPALRAVFKKLSELGLLDEIKSFGGCFMPRFIRGYEKEAIPSIHTWALAVDFNTNDNPLNVNREQAIEKGLTPFTHEFQQVWRDLGWTVGYDFSRCDGMHFEFTTV